MNAADLNAYARIAHAAAGLHVANRDADLAAVRAVERDELLDRAATVVMAVGAPGGHRSQHDPECHLHTCYPRAPWCPGCDRLPGCGWPEGGGAP